ncbi:hypothetical protein J437_LFUL013565 [Ladona fulva]|uniref:Translocation protein SEC62 n=1 Tax=Ladona fulva TaxID=123851 RepID=A0A8K0KF15_LADFU|nr:hypothetical protein J437_LFUL013565 [Ladona fulva]
MLLIYSFQDEKDKKKRKIKLEMHLEQIFVDGWDAYVWIYDPIPVYYWFFGSLLVIGAIAICLFPLWPPTVSYFGLHLAKSMKGVYYLSLVAAGFLILVIALAVIRLVVFCLIWVFTFGKHHLWIFPNLTEDVGFLASFWPLWQYEYKGDSNGDKGKKKKKDKDSDNEEEPSNEENNEKDNSKDPDVER